MPIQYSRIIYSSSNVDSGDVTSNPMKCSSFSYIARSISKNNYFNSSCLAKFFNQFQWICKNIKFTRKPLPHTHENSLTVSQLKKEACHLATVGNYINVFQSTSSTRISRTGTQHQHCSSVQWLSRQCTQSIMVPVDTKSAHNSAQAQYLERV